MSKYLKNDYFTKVKWSQSQRTAVVEFPPDVISLNPRPIIQKHYKFYEDKIVLTSNKNVIAPKYSQRVLLTVDIFLGNIVCCIPKNEVYLETDNGWKPFEISQIDLDLTDEEKKLEWSLSTIFKYPNDKRQSLSIELGIADGFEIVSDLLKIGGF